MVYVRNLHGTGDNKPPSGFSSWKDYWEFVTGRPFGKCSCVTCAKMAEVGGHVIKDSGSKEWYITPLCTRHNNPFFTDSFVVSECDLIRVR